jgi:hypothetical protein
MESVAPSVGLIAHGAQASTQKRSRIENETRSIREIAFHIVFIVAPILEIVVKPFACPVYFAISGLRQAVTFTYYCVTIPDFIGNCISSVKSFFKEGPSVPLKTTISNFLETVNVFGPNKKEAIKNIAIIALKTLSWSLLIASFFVAPQVSFFLCLGMSAIALGFAIDDYYKNRIKSKEHTLPQSLVASANPA